MNTFCSKLSGDYAISLLSTINEKPDFLSFLNENIKAKKEAFMSGNKEALDKIFNKEDSFLNDFAGF